MQMRLSKYQSDTRTAVLVLCWFAMLLGSSAPAVVVRVWFGFAAGWLDWLLPGTVAAMLVASIRWSAFREMRPYVLMLFVLMLASWLLGLVRTAPWWQQIVWPVPVVVHQLVGEQVIRLTLTGIMLGALLVIHPQSTCLLSFGQGGALAAPVPWIGLTRPTPWRRFGPIFALYISGGTLVFLVLAGRPSLAAVPQMIPVMPYIVLIAAANAWSEEISYRASLLAPLRPIVGDTQALLITAALFGLGHYQGIPSGIVGVGMAGVLGWLLGKSMVETGGVFWAWFVHFWQDVLIFSFIVAATLS